MTDLRPFNSRLGYGSTILKYFGYEDRTGAPRCRAALVKKRKYYSVSWSVYGSALDEHRLDNIVRHLAAHAEARLHLLYDELRSQKSVFKAIAAGGATGHWDNLTLSEAEKVWQLVEQTWAGALRIAKDTEAEPATFNESILQELIQQARSGVDHPQALLRRLCVAYPAPSRDNLLWRKINANSPLQVVATGPTVDVS